MTQIFDNIELRLVEGLCNILPKAQAAAFCVGYLNLRGWDQLADFVEYMPGGEEKRACRILVGMHRPPKEEMKALASLKCRITESFKEQLEFGVPTAQAEQSLSKLAAQLRARKVFLKAFLRYPLHAKLYLVRRDDPVTSLIGFVGSSNLTLAGLPARRTQCGCRRAGCRAKTPEAVRRALAGRTGFRSYRHAR